VSARIRPTSALIRDTTCSNTCKRVSYIIYAPTRAANGAFRLWTRSDTAAKAMLVRAELIRFTLAQCHTTPPLWSIEQAIDLLQYFDSCWALPGYPPVMD